MPPKRRGGQAKLAPATKAAPPEQPKPSSSKLAPVPAPTPIPLPQPVEAGATKVRKEWTKFMDAWYQPQKKKWVEKLQKDLLVKYKNLGSPKETQKLREMELFEKLDSIAQQLSQPARAEWERRLDVAQLREEEWDDMSGEEQQAVMSVFVGFFADDVEDMDDDDVSADPSSIEEDDSVVEGPQYRGASSSASKQPIPPTPIRGTFEFVNPTSFFTDTVTPPNHNKNLPALSMDHLATLGPSNAGRSADPASANVGSMFSFQNWASEAGIVTQQPPGQPVKPPAVSTAQSLSPRPHATEHMSRQASTASNLSYLPTKTTSPPYSPPNLPTKFSPSTNTENLPLGKRYIGPIITEEEPDPIGDELLKSKMAEEYQQYKISLRIQMIYQFHAEAAEVEVKLFETLLACEGTKESRARAVQEHETNMMHLREQKEEERKKLCAEERERRLEEMRQHLAQRRPATQNREVDPSVKANSLAPKIGPDKMVQERRAKVTHQKENVPLPPPIAAPSSKLEPPSVINKSNSILSQDEASANEAVFANAVATMAQGKVGATTLTSAQASLNEALFANAAAALAVQGQPGTSRKNTLQPPSTIKKSNSSRSQEYDIPQITFSFAGAPAVTPEPPQAPPAAVKGKKGKKGQPAVQPPPAKPVTINEEPEMNEEPPPLTQGPSLWDAATPFVAKNTRGTVSASESVPKSKLSASVEELEDDLVSATVSIPSKASVGAKKPAPAAKKGRKVTITEEPDVDADLIITPPPSSKAKATKGAWGSVNAKSKVAVPIVESEPEPAPPPPPSMSAWGKKSMAQPATQSTAKPQLKVTITEEPDSEFERSPVPPPARSNKAKSAWDVQRQQVEHRRGGTKSSSKSVRVDTVPDPDDQWPGPLAGDNTTPGVMESAGSAGAEEEGEDEGDASAWFKPEDLSYWANFMSGSSEAEPEQKVVPPAAEQTGKHARWTPTMNESDEEEFGEAEADLATNMWMQYAISGGDIPSLGDAPEQPQFTSSESAQADASLWEQGRGKKKANLTNGDFGNRAQQTSVFDRAAITGQWPKMESWLSPPARGQNSGSTRVF